MSVMAWWAIPVVATLVAIVAVYWANRPHRSESDRSIEEFQRFRSALGQQTTGPTGTLPDRGLGRRSTPRQNDEQRTSRHTP